MKVMIVHNHYRSAAPSGENRVVEQESEALAALGHQVTRFERHSDEIERWPAAKKAMLPARIVWNGEARRDLAAALRRDPVDVVHLHNTFPLLSSSVLYACRDAGIPVVATIHNYKLACASGDFYRDGAVCHDCAAGHSLRAVRHGCYRGSPAATAPVALAVSLHRRAWRSLVSAYVFISASQRDLLAGLGLPRDRVMVRHNLIPRRQAPPGQPREEPPGQPREAPPGGRRDGSPAAPREGPHGPPTGPRGGPGAAAGPMVLYAGRLDEAKGVPLLMAGWDRYLAATPSPGLRLVIAGGGPLGGEVSAWAAARPSVAVAGQLSAGDCARLMAGARTVILPSTWEETFGLVAVEAMALGVPPVAAGHGSFPEIITDGADGVLFRPGDAAALAAAIAAADGDPQRFRCYGEQARKTYERRFAPERSIEDLLRIYRFAIDHPA